MGSVIALHPPAPPARPAAVTGQPLRLPTTGGRRGEYALADVARSLGLLHFGVRTIVEKLRVMAKAKGMPLPRTPRIVNGETLAGPAAIYSRSRWDAGEFDAWLDDRGPHGSPAAQATPRPIAPPIRDEMARRAHLLAVA